MNSKNKIANYFTFTLHNTRDSERNLSDLRSSIADVHNFFACNLIANATENMNMTITFNVNKCIK